MVMHSRTIKGVIGELLVHQAGMLNGKRGSMHIFPLMIHCFCCQQAKLWILPTIFVCKDNQYRMGTSATHSSSNTKCFMHGDNGLQVHFLLLFYLYPLKIHFIINYRSMEWISLHQNMLSNMPENGQLTMPKVKFYLNLLHTTMEDICTVSFVFSFVI